MNNEQQVLGTDIIPAIKAQVDKKQDALVSEGENQNIKTVNGNSLLGSGDIEIVTTYYDKMGQNTDKAMTQKATTDAITNVVTETSEKYATIDSLTAETTARTEVETTLQTNIDSANTKIESLEGYAGETVQLDTTLSTENTDSTVTLIKKQGALDDVANATETELPLPVVSATQAGILNPATYQTIQDNAEKIENLLGASVAVEDLPAEPTQEQLTDAWKEASGKEEIVNGAKIFDSTNNKTWTYYSNKSAWSSIDNANPTIELTNFTNEAAGQIKGDSTTDGKIQAETDGTGSVKGWDTVKSDIANNTSDIESAQSEIANIKTTIEGLGGTYALKTTVDELQKEVTDNAGDISALEADKQDKLVGSGEGQNIKTVNGNSLLGTGDIAVQAVLVASGANQNIKTINNTSLLGTGNIAIDVPEAMTVAEFTAAWNAA